MQLDEIARSVVCSLHLSPSRAGSTGAVASRPTLGLAAAGMVVVVDAAMRC
jgi:hypothetical protein